MDLHNEICSLVDVVKGGAEDRRFAASYFSCKHLVIVDVKGLNERDCYVTAVVKHPSTRTIGSEWLVEMSAPFGLDGRHFVHRQHQGLFIIREITQKK